MSSIIFGNPGNMDEGTCFPSRAAQVEAGLHRSLIAGIDGNGIDGASAIVLSGGYEDDVDRGDIIIYTGHGGNNTNTGKQIEHQTWDAPGNAGLVVSKNKKLPIRVIRGFKHKSKLSPQTGYKYGGLYRVVDCYEKMGKSGFIVCLFKLIKLENEDDISNHIVKKGTLVLLETNGKEKWFSIGVDAPDSQKLSSDSNFAQLLLEKKEGEIIDFGSGFKIKKISKYLS